MTCSDILGHCLVASEINKHLMPRCPTSASKQTKQQERRVTFLEQNIRSRLILHYTQILIFHLANKPRMMVIKSFGYDLSCAVHDLVQ